MHPFPAIIRQLQIPFFSAISFDDYVSLIAILVKVCYHSLNTIIAPDSISNADRSQVYRHLVC